MRWENVHSFFAGKESAYKDEVKEIDPRPLTNREAQWIRDILQVSDGWRKADLSKTQVVAEGPTTEGLRFVLRASEPENPRANSRRESVGELWINTDDNCTINVQLSQFQGQLRELYVLFVDPQNPKRKLPESWIEVSREATNI
jgi:hypothetical protein